MHAATTDTASYSSQSGGIMKLADVKSSLSIELGAPSP